MTANQPAPKPPAARQSRFPVWRLVLAALAAGVALGAAFALFHRPAKSAPLAVSTLPGRPAASWPARSRLAPGFRLEDAAGAPISLKRFRGHAAIVTFIDPVCTSLCPLEAKALNDALATLPPARRPAILAVSVNPWADSRANFRHDERKWHLVPEWHWAAGRYAQLAPVWKSYDIGVLDRKTNVHGLVVHNVSHTEASFVIDSHGYERALFLYPFVGRDVAAVIGRLTG